MKNQQHRDSPRVDQDQQQTYGWTLHMLDLHTTFSVNSFFLRTINKLGIIDRFRASVMNYHLKKKIFDEIRSSEDEYYD